MADTLKIVFSKHARYQLLERDMSELAVKRCVYNPDKIVRQPNNRIQATKKTQQHKKPYLLIVVYEKHNSTVEIITAFYTSKIKKYL